MAQASGMAAAIRGSTESDTFDLAGQNLSTITNTMTSAFKDPLPIREMIRITFITGAGKLGRQKYDDGAAKALTSALRELSFEEDRGASCVNECAGSFKLQHDTGKNLKTVVVFPNILEGGDDENGADGDDHYANSASSGPSLIPKNSPEDMIAQSSMKVFPNMIKSRCPSWSQKKGAVAALTSIKEMLDELDQKLLTGTPLADNEQELYDAVSSTVLEEKQVYLRDEMHAQVDTGVLTAKEKSMLLEQVTDKLNTASKDLAEAERDGKPKKVEKLKGMQEKLKARKEKLTNVAAKGPHRLKHEPDILKLHAEMRPLLDLEEKTKGRLLSIKETQTLARKDEIMDEISELEHKSRGWFEDDDAFAARVQVCQKACESKSKAKKKATGAKKAAAPAATRTAAWMAAPVSRAKGPAAKSKPKSSANRGGGVFAAMMLDSDSD